MDNNNSTLEAQLNAVSFWFESWIEKNPVFEKKIYWKLVKNASSSRPGKHVFTNSTTSDPAESLELLSQHIINEYNTGTHRLTVTISDNKSYDKDSPEKQLNFNENKSNIALKRNSSTGSNDYQMFFFKSMLELKEEAHKKEIEYQNKLNAIEMGKRDERIAAIEAQTTSKSKFWDFVDNLVENSDKIEGIAERWVLAQAKLKQPQALGNVLAHKGFGAKEEQERISVGKPKHKISGATLDYKRGIELLENWNNLYPDILDGLTALYNAHKDPEQSQEITEQFQKLKDL